MMKHSILEKPLARYQEEFLAAVVIRSIHSVRSRLTAAHFRTIFHELASLSPACCQLLP
jgi:hypothetical protein